MDQPMTPAEALALVLRYARWSAASNKSGLGYHDTAAKMRKEIAEAERVLRAALAEQQTEAKP